MHFTMSILGWKRRRRINCHDQMETAVLRHLRQDKLHCKPFHKQIVLETNSESE